MSTPYRDLAKGDETRAPGGPLPPARYAPSLEGARPGDLLWLDREGNVRPLPALPARRWKVLSVALPAGSLACLYVVVALPYAGWRAFAGAALLFYLFAAAVAWQGTRAARALRLLGAGRDAEAATAADGLLAHPILAAGFQRIAHLVKARAAARAANHVDALHHYRAIRYATSTRVRRSSVLNAVAEMALFEEILTLCNAGRGEGGGAYLEEAKALLAGARMQYGDYLVLLRDVARLSVAFATDDPSAVGAAEVEAMVRRYAKLASAFGVLALAAWHATRTNHEAVARRALDAELSKPRSVPLAVAMPAVAAWVDSKTHAEAE